MAERTAETAFFSAVGRATKEAVAAHLAATSADLRFQRQILLLLAVLEGTTAGDRIDAVDYRLAYDAASDAAAVCRTQPPSATIVTVIDRLDEIVGACERALGRQREHGWERFLFAEADLEVFRAPGVWRVRSAAGEAEEASLERALKALLPALGESRIAALGAQIAGW